METCSETRISVTQNQIISHPTSVVEDGGGSAAYIKTIPKLQCLLAATARRRWRTEEPLPPLTQHASDEEEHRRADEHAGEEEVAEHEDQSNPERAAEVVDVGEAPGDAGEEEKEGEKVGEGRIGAVIGGLGLFLADVGVRWDCCEGCCRGGGFMV